MFSPTDLEEKLDYIHGRIYKTAIMAGRNPQDITLIAITKTLSPEIWQQAFNINQTIFGENRVQEAQEKVETFSKRDKIELHLIGHLQSNKAKKAISLFDIIQTVDSIKLAGRIDRICKTLAKKQHIYIQVNTSGDQRKHGISLENVITAAKEISKNNNLILGGIMTIPPPGITQAELTSIYKKTRIIRDKIRSRINQECQNISMGMSSDYEIAIAEGATHIRIGTGLFGARQQ